MSISERDFNAVAAATPKKKPREAPFSLRLSFEEKALLRAAANGAPLGAYIKAKLFDEPLEKVRRRNTNPVKDHEALGRVLGALGKSRLSQNLNQIARAANMGALPVSPELEDELRQACADVETLRKELLRALGSLSNGGSS
ncbi:hypothetical protein [Maritimibacter fusiformis]|uniref:Bacterial mobilisation domain-containing protein n=1 Tax=Maritimibacter fusiformis TaxID=2603819 RepID=A0A5D0RR89_9RHOB|nr:hypothetical protein [Maritimibacter fusiformis]TYB83466.1 hypothetical protein FVF75_00095 [Maritimibacter fusiformis]